MAIKSAYELAMERASSVKIDKDKLRLKEFETKGKEAASKFLNTPKFNFEEWLDSLEEDSKTEYLKGCSWVFIKNIILPMTPQDIDKLLKIKEGYIYISSEDDLIEELFNNLITAFQQYIDNSKTLLEQCKEEFAPRLQQKAMQIAQQTGQMIPIDPESDREFIDFQRGQQEQLDNYYKEFIKQVTDRLEALF